jgi:hypothetical protein
MLDSAPLMAGRFRLHFSCARRRNALPNQNNQLTLEKAHQTPLLLSEHRTSRSLFLLKAHLLHARHHVVLFAPPLGQYNSYSFSDLARLRQSSFGMHATPFRPAHFRIVAQREQIAIPTKSRCTYKRLLKVFAPRRISTRFFPYVCSCIERDPFEVP